MQTHDVDSVALNKIFESLISLVERLKNKLNTKLKAVENKEKCFVPRLVRLCKKLKLTKKESTALEFIILHNIGIHFPPGTKNYDARGMLRNMARVSNMTSKEVLNFLSPHKRWIKDDLFSRDEDFLSYDFSSQVFRMRKEVLSALMGGILTQEELMAIEGTALAEVLEEEGYVPLKVSSPKPKDEKVLGKK
eukprot:UN26014